MQFPDLVQDGGDGFMGGMAPFVYRHITGESVFRLLVEEHLGEHPKPPRPPFDSTGISIALGSIGGGMLPDEFETRIAEVKEKYQPVAYSLSLKAGQHIPKQSGNYTVFGFCCLSAETVEEARALGLNLISDLEAAFGFEMAKYDL